MRTQFSKFALAALAVHFALSVASAANIPSSCAEEIITISKGNGFDMQKFTSSLVPAVAKAKLQAKAPFGKPKDSDKTDIGMTFGCLKAFPESATEITSLLKDIGLETAKGVLTNKSEASAKRENSFGATNVIANKRSAVNKFPQAYANSTVVHSAPALKECDAVFNPSKKFCYDGEVYNLCDGMAYNPTTHICSGDIANRALCNGMQYNPLKQKCENDAILTACGKTTYNPQTHGCKDNTVFALSKCGTIIYDPTTHICKDNSVFPKCGETIYDPTTHGCKDNSLFVLSRCGATEFYDPKTQVCSFGTVFEK